MPVRTRISYEKALYVLIFIEQFVGVVTVQRTTVFSVETSGANAHINKFTGG